jgi:redox-sensitive bicupin YhaK (pirin superfamily)
MKYGMATHSSLREGRRAYVHVVREYMATNGESLTSGDAVKVTDVSCVTLENAADAEVLLFDLP